MTVQSGNTLITIAYTGQEPVRMTADDMAKLAGASFPLSTRIAGAAGEAFDFGAWFTAWRDSQGIAADAPLPTHLKVEAVDTFEALVPWEQLKDAAVQYAIGGEALHKGGPIRLYVPHGSSECLNVKSVVVCKFIHDEEKRGEVSYGFKQTFSAEEMRLKK
ncbi:hypothetical protein [Paenibacillus sp. CF384]|uniref:hypothetical protein n=1 Tax=Paenibacillus sp. CF384 TaxID=1884382 RepID=UPI000896B9F0|nr:hypothetical protein [Paenibacillus sp. CF384]SDX20128.1 hypothetical protein SAMN05518855_101095 [Paenibacillus sp. CF384]